MIFGSSFVAPLRDPLKKERSTTPTFRNLPVEKLYKKQGADAATDVCSRSFYFLII